MATVPPMLWFLECFVLGLRTGTGQTDGQTDERGGAIWKVTRKTSLQLCLV